MRSGDSACGSFASVFFIVKDKGGIVRADTGVCPYGGCWPVVPSSGEEGCGVVATNKARPIKLLGNDLFFLYHP